MKGSLPLIYVMKRASSSNLSKEPTAAKMGHWTEALLHSMNDPALKILEDDRVIVIKDKFPKAEFHYLVLPKKNIPSISHVKKEDADLMKHMEDVGENLCKKHDGHEFIIGYHAIPSMQRMHLHVVSTDFNSPCLKKKQHWNSFTTPFFIPSHKLRSQLETEGQIKLNSSTYEAHLQADLKCHKCFESMKNMPQLKRHLLEHISSDEKNNEK